MYETIELLKLIGYDVTQSYKHITGKGVYGIIQNNYIYIDKKGFYDKPNKCELRLPIPKSINQFLFLANKMKEISRSKDNQSLEILEYPIK